MSTSPTTQQPIHVLVVDDSAVMRQFMMDLLSRQPAMTVAVAADPLIGMRKMGSQRPDVIVLDLEMPKMDGLTFLKKVMTDDPTPVVVCSSHAEQGTTSALRALEEGAVEVMAKPKLGVRDFLEESSTLFIDTIRAASQARLGPRLPLTRPSAVPPDVVKGSQPLRFDRSTPKEIVAIGASTGGTEALLELLRTLPRDAPGLAIVQHMPEHFTKAFAQRLNEVCRMEVKEAEDGDRIRPGTALIARGDQHLKVERRDDVLVATLCPGPLVSRHRPSVDVLFGSVARSAGKTAIGIIMTGMGKDGALGLLEMRQQGALTLAQDEASSVVYGMPKEAIALDAVKKVVPLAGLAAMILR